MIDWFLLNRKIYNNYYYGYYNLYDGYYEI